MTVKIRLARGGAKKRPFYRIVVADERAPRDGKFIEKLGVYNPLLAKDNPERVVINLERAKEWIAKGAQPTDKLEKILVAKGALKAKTKFSSKPKKAVKNPGKYPDKAPADAGAAAEAAPAAEAAAEA